ncbi:MAG TPA: ABC transporter permease [Bryobacteraceae bacterium]|nr:ABC transporter permease [Bryobacteraceae bacterium]
MIVQNLRYAVRSLRKSPLLTATAVAALALGIGANTALFSVINVVLLQRLSYPHPEQIVELSRAYHGNSEFSYFVSAPKFAFWAGQNHSFEAVAAHTFTPVGLNLVGQGEPQRLGAMAATAGYFQVFGVRPLIGRTYTAAEDNPGAGHYAVLSYGLWRKLYHGDPNVVGKALPLSDQSFTILGVMPRDFTDPAHADLWVPLQLKIDPSDISNNYPVIARLKPGVSLESARADMRLVADRFHQTYPHQPFDKDESVAVLKFHDFLVGSAKAPLWILLASVGLVLLIACANVANLLLARSTSRQREMAIRVAVGASGRQIVVQSMTESLLLALSGAAAGCLLAASLLPTMLYLVPADIPQLGAARIDWRVLLFALAVAVFTAILFGLFPAVQSARLGIANPLRESGTRTTTNAVSRRARQSLVVAELAITLLLLIGAALLIKTLRNLQTVLPGFAANNVLTLQMSLGDKYAQPEPLAQVTERVTNRLRTIPGVVSVATAGMLPMNAMVDLPFDVVGRTTKADDIPDEKYRFVSGDYFATLSIPVVSGREFTEQDRANAAPVMVINQAFANKYFPKENPLGQQIVIGRVMGPKFTDKPRRIVGVTGNVRDSGLDSPAPPEMYIPEAQAPSSMLALDLTIFPVNLIVRTTHDPMSMAGLIRREALTTAGDIPMTEAHPLTDVLRDSLARQKFVMTLLTVFAGLALLLGVVGLYGVISYSVAQRTRELGIRSALGAKRADLLRLVVSEGMRLTGIGLLCGLVAAYALTRFLQSLLYGVSAIDPVVLAAVTLILAGVGLVACVLPAYRASRVDPLVALHQE